MILALQFLDDIIETTWQRFYQNFETQRLTNQTIEWGLFYEFAGRKALTKQQGRRLAQLWATDNRIHLQKKGIRFSEVFK